MAETSARRACVDCGRPLPPRSRPGALRCRVCRAREAQAFLQEALANPHRQREHRLRRALGAPRCPKGAH
jgi:hypothetical protein